MRGRGRLSPATGYIRDPAAVIAQNHPTLQKLTVKVGSYKFGLLRAASFVRDSVVLALTATRLVSRE